MAAVKKARPTFRATFLVRYVISREIEADSLEDAIVKGKEDANLRGFLPDDECADDGGVQLVGVSDDDAWRKVD